MNCNDGVHTNITITFSLGGGRAATSTIQGIAAGTVCTVVEQNTEALPPGSIVTYNPAGANTTGVTISATAGVTVGITNDFSGSTAQSGNLSLVKTVVAAPPGFTLPHRLHRPRVV